MDKRFQQVDKRFEDMQHNMDKRFESMDKRFESLQHNMDKRFNATQWFMGTGFAAVVLVVTLLEYLFQGVRTKSWTTKEVVRGFL